MRLCLENTQHKKRAGGMGQVVKCLPSKCEALRTAKKKKKERKKRKKNL
jgi:hypothetical protein